MIPPDSSPSDSPDATPRKKLGQQLWDALETAQGHSFVSDDMCYWDDGQVLDFVRKNLANVRKVARVFGRINRGYKFEGEP